MFCLLLLLNLPLLPFVWQLFVLLNIQIRFCLKKGFYCKARRRLGKVRRIKGQGWIGVGIGHFNSEGYEKDSINDF